MQAVAGMATSPRLLLLTLLLVGAVQAACDRDGVRRAAPSAPGPAVTNAVDEEAAVVITAGQSIQAAVEANPPDTRFLIKAGRHHGQTITPKDGMSFIGEPGAVLDGEESPASCLRDAAREGEQRDDPGAGDRAVRATASARRHPG
jgi:hypothetical protein